MGVTPCGREHGRDASPLLRGEAVAWEDICFVHHAANRAAIFTPEFELGYVKGRDAILFDRRRDPDQVDNLFGRESHREIVADLTATLVAHHASVKSPATEFLRAL